MKKIALLIAIFILSILAVACSTETTVTTDEIKVGYFPNMSHAPAMIGLEKGIYEEELEDFDITTSTFPNGSLFMDALSTGQIDIGYVGPGPALNRFLQGGELVVISNASVGENVLVVRSDLELNSVKDLEGKIVATPSTGCTHDLLLRKMLQEEGMAVEENGGNVQRIAQKPATMIGLFQQKQIDAAVVSEPWASLMEAEGVVKVVRDAKEVPWEGNLPATVLVVRKEFLESNPEAVEEFIVAHEKSIDFINANKEEAISLVGEHIKLITDQGIEEDIIANSFNRVEFTSKVDKGILQQFADLSKELGFIEGSSDLKELFWQKIGE